MAGEAAGPRGSSTMTAGQAAVLCGRRETLNRTAVGWLWAGAVFIALINGVSTASGGITADQSAFLGASSGYITSPRRWSFLDDPGGTLGLMGQGQSSAFASMRGQGSGTALAVLNEGAGATLVAATHAASARPGAKACAVVSRRCCLVGALTTFHPAGVWGLCRSTNLSVTRVPNEA
jgi:hypothetical protein